VAAKPNPTASAVAAAAPASRVMVFDVTKRQVPS